MAHYNYFDFDKEIIMTVKAGIVCGNCDYLNSVNSVKCRKCGNSLKLRADNTKTADQLEKKTGLQSVAGQGKEGEPMEQARYFVCSECYSPVPAGHKFCGKCGHSLEENVEVQPEYFGELQTPGKAKLILVKGEGVDGLSYHLNSTEHIAGRSENGQIVFADDPWLSPVHANFIYEEGELKVRDENSLNGIFVAIKEPTIVSEGAVFMAGEQIFRIENVAPVNDEPEADGTYFFSSPNTNGTFRIVQILEGGGDGMVVNAKEDFITVGREDCDMNFPGDPFISGQHAKVESVNGQLRLTDLNSKNGTFIKINQECSLAHGDYLFLGRQLLRVEINN
jgi:pSer/pThr/pTyr-binding forkhead associated (FHA) protein/ribosomal protein L40E